MKYLTDGPFCMACQATGTFELAVATVADTPLCADCIRLLLGEPDTPDADGTDRPET